MSNDLLLRRTPEEIRAYNRRNDTSFGILKVVNLLSPRNWRFTFAFKRETIVLSIQSQPLLTATDFRRIADGTIPEVLNGTELLFADAANYAVRCALSPETRSNVLPASPWTPAGFDGLQILGFRDNILPPAFQNTLDVQQHLYELTWFGSHYKAPTYGSRSLVWNVFGAVDTYRPRPRSHMLTDSDPMETFQCEVFSDGKDHIGSATLAVTSSRHIGSNKLYHSRLGVITSATVLRDWLPRKHVSKIGLLVELDENRLSYGPDGEIGPYDLWTAVRRSLGRAVLRCCQSAQFADFMTTLERVDRTRSAKALALRQDALRARTRIYHGETELGCVPESENEVVVILAKLEVLGGIPIPLFRLLEYTPRQGIDALGDFQLTNAAAPERLAPIEIEFHFENFLRHGHAVEQVRLIVCWDFRSEATRAGAALAEHKDWLYTYSQDQYSVSVFVLSRLPGLTERSNEK